jgi:hypothetical protein
MPFGNMYANHSSSLFSLIDWLNHLCLCMRLVLFSGSQHLLEGKKRDGKYACFNSAKR